ncbi:hypothetical protein BofuT4_uP115100.1 [Botrytis cinerea T4]|uniref:Uncharacterized protein n=1 Tax=Botryotinia fuckeliana (strain T4) TaxID=999810 RepID=G2Y2B4_BOTF4|nr:hypothetical protein BofuT4_uP115100.1 [Botrytis cinerea T4]
MSALPRILIFLLSLVPSRRDLEFQRIAVSFAEGARNICRELDPFVRHS